jgi:hypothetical protein
MAYIFETLTNKNGTIYSLPFLSNFHLAPLIVATYYRDFISNMTVAHRNPVMQF